MTSVEVFTRRKQFSRPSVGWMTRFKNSLNLKLSQDDIFYALRTLRTNAGFSLFELLLTTALATFVLLLGGEAILISAKGENQIKLKNTCNSMQLNLISLFQNPMVIKNTFGAPANSVCNPNTIGYNPTICAPYSINTHIDIYAADPAVVVPLFDGQIYSDGISPGRPLPVGGVQVAGFTLDGASCLGFTPLGNSACPLKFEISADFISNNQTNLKVDMLYAPSSDKLVFQTCSSSSLNRIVNYNLNSASGLPISALPPEVTAIDIEETIGTGTSHTCGVADGSLLTWGKNDHGQCGQKNKIEFDTPVKVPELVSNVSQCSAGGHHTCAIRDDEVWCMGEDAENEVGDGLGVDRPTPFKVPFPAPHNKGGVSHICSGEHHNCAIVDDEIWCWGRDTNGELGDNDTVAHNPKGPTRVLHPTPPNPPLAPARAVAAGLSHTCAAVKGEAWCWGTNSFGENGHNGVGAADWGPVSQVLEATTLTPLGGVTDVAVGDKHSCAISNGKVYCWGDNTLNQLGVSTAPATQSSVAVAVPIIDPASGLPITGATRIHANGNHTFCIVGTMLFTWGDNPNGVQGTGILLGSATPTTLPDTFGAGAPLSSVYAVSTGPTHTCAIVSGSIQCWGGNLNGQLGINTNIDSLSPVATLSPTVATAGAPILGSVSGLSSIHAGGWSGPTCAILNGGLECWGYNSQGMVGNNTIVDALIPTRPTTNLGVPTLTKGVQWVSGASDKTCVIVNGGVQCMGQDGFMGPGAILNSMVPVPLGPQTGVVALGVELGDVYCAIKDGQVLCWGNDSSDIGFPGMLGRGPAVIPGGSDANPAPVLRADDYVGTNSGILDNVTALAVGACHYCALRDDRVWCWGMTFFGVLGQNDTAAAAARPLSSPYALQVLDPTDPTGFLTGVTSVATSGEAVCVISRGAVKCWGDSSFGEVGNGLMVGEFSTPQAAVGGLDQGVTTISSEGTSMHFCAIKNGSLYCWGTWDFLGGSLTGMNAATPAPVSDSTGLSIMTGVQKLRVGGGRTCYVVNGRAFCMGFGYRGDGSLTDYGGLPFGPLKLLK